MTALLSAILAYRPFLDPLPIGNSAAWVWLLVP